MNNLLSKYPQFILKLNNVPKYWFILRFIIHWITLPIKLLVIGGLGIYQIIYQELFFSNRKIENTQDKESKLRFIRFVMSKLPIARNINDEVYCPRVPYYVKANGYNHNKDHQAAWHGVYTFLMGKIGKRNSFQEIAMSKHMHGEKLFRGYDFNGNTNANTVSGDMLVGTSLAMLDVKSNTLVGGPITSGGSGDVLRDKFDEVVIGIIENDFALLEGNQPEDGPERAVWDNELNRVKDSSLIRMKSARGMWQPGLETVGAQALTLLAAVRVADKRCGSILPKKTYKKLLNKYGYGLLSLFPTAFTQSKRGYYNDNNCMVSAYILAKLADTKLGRLFWTIPMLYIFLLSYKWRNGYFTGLLLDVAPYLKPFMTNHIEQCQAYLYEEMPIPYARDNGIEIQVNKGLPVKFNDTNQGEFLYDHESKLFTNKYIDNNGEQGIMQTDNTHSGLGWLASAIMIDNELVKESLEKN